MDIGAENERKYCICRHKQKYMEKHAKKKEGFHGRFKTF